LDYQLLSSVGLLLVFTGFVITFIAAILLMLSSLRVRGKIRGGGAVLIGPFPIIFGTDRESIKILMLFSIVIIVLMLVYLFAYHILK